MGITKRPTIIFHIQHRVYQKQSIIEPSLNKLFVLKQLKESPQKFGHVRK